MGLANTNSNISRTTKRDKASYFARMLTAHTHHDHGSLDNESNDYKEMRESIILGKRNPGQRSQAQLLNYNSSRLLQLPTEVLLQIFKYLDKGDLYSLLTVCREFSDLIVEILWFRPNMQSDVTFQKIKHVMSLPRNQTHWDYRNYIKRLNLSFMTKLVDDELLDLFAGCPKLERLTLVNCTKLTHAPITRALQNCERLQSIDMTGVQDIQDDIINALAQNCTRLQGLYAPGCGNVSEKAIIGLLHACPMLKRIKFNNSENITNESILAMYENCKSLVEIDLHNCPLVTDKYLKHIFYELTQLREFRISNAPGITDDLFELIPEDYYLDKLRIIDVTGCNAITDKLVERMVRYAPRLRNVVLSKCIQITDASLRHLTKLGRSLHYIHLGHCALITDFGVQALVRACHRIQYIDLACCSQLTDWTLIELSNLPKLRRIGLVKCNLISDSGIMELVRRRGEQDCLERVHLSYCTNLTIGPIYFLLKNCPRLTHLSLTGISAFLRREITQYCRDPPPDFTENQKSSFCVFSGHGVVQLRNYLDAMMEQRAYILEQYGFQEDVTSIFPERRRRVLGQQTTELTRSPTGISPSPPNEVFGNQSFVMTASVQPAATEDENMEGEEDMSAWAAQRGLGGLRRTNMSPESELETPMVVNGARYNDADAILRQLLSLEQLNRRRAANINGITDTGPVAVRPGDAPQISQPPVFLNDDIQFGATSEDTEMEAVDLFPRRNIGDPSHGSN